MVGRILLVLAAVFGLVAVSDAGPLQRRRAHVQNYSHQFTKTQSYSVQPSGAAMHTTTRETTVTASYGTGNALDAVNAKRAARGLRPFVYDPALTEAAQRCAAFRAERGLFGHTSNDFSFLPSGASASSAGCAAYPESYGFMACCVYEGYTYAGAASVRGADGRMYHHLFVR